MATIPPWEKGDWIPGALSRKQVGMLCGGFIDNCDSSKIDQSSMDLHLSGEAYRLREGAAKPSGEQYLYGLKREKLVEELAPGPRGTFLLEAKQTYLFKLKERLRFNEKSGIYGQATAKSSVGRMDVLARLIVDGMDGYEEFRPESVDGGDMFLEVTPLTFKVEVKAGIALSQLRYFYGKPSDVQISGDIIHRTLLKESERGDGMLSVDLSNTTIAGERAAAFRAEDNVQSLPAIPMWTEPGMLPPAPTSYWRKVPSDEHRRLTIEKEAFYILRSKERISLPKGVAVYCRAIDETIGEMRIHYAGFVHPFFGHERRDEEVGTPLIFEVRGHDTNVSLKHGEKLARLTFYRMSEDAERSDEDDNTYNEQILQLSKYFGKW